MLLLDEPTNYLDLEGTMWLESYLGSYPHSVLIVSHDRDLLNRAVGAILHLDRGRLALYTGTYDEFEDALRERQSQQLKLKKRQDEERRRIEAFIVRFKARRQGDEAQAVLAHARMKPIVAQVEAGSCRTTFQWPSSRWPSTLRSRMPSRVTTRKARCCVGSICAIDNDDRISLLGQIGNGSATFAKLIAGMIAAVSGGWRHRVVIGFFASISSMNRTGHNGLTITLPGCSRCDEGRARASADTGSASTRQSPAVRTYRAARRRGSCSC